MVTYSRDITDLAGAVVPRAFFHDHGFGGDIAFDHSRFHQVEGFLDVHIALDPAFDGGISGVNIAQHLAAVAHDLLVDDPPDDGACGPADHHR